MECRDSFIIAASALPGIDCPKDIPVAVNQIVDSMMVHRLNPKMKEVKYCKRIAVKDAR
jgi:hypothetical protein